MKDKLLHSIQNMKKIRFQYGKTPEKRIADPCILGYKDGKLRINCFQKSGGSDSGQSQHPMYIFVDDMKGIEFLDENFNETPSEYKPDSPLIDHQFDTIIFKLPKDAKPKK